jgi:hypothetical protein
MHPSRYSMKEPCSLRLIDAKLSQVKGGQGIEETVILMEESKRAINSRNHKLDTVMK